MKIAADSTNLKQKLQHGVVLFHKYSVVAFLVFLFGIYGFLAWSVFTLDQAEPDPAEVSAQLKTTSKPSIDEDLIKKIQQLEDNSVSVQSLFDEARKNPFKE